MTTIAVLAAVLSGVGPGVVVTKDGGRIEAARVEERGRLLLVTDKGGRVFSLRVDQVDEARSESATVARAAQVAAAADAAEREAVLAYAERQRVADIRRANAAQRGRHRFGISIASGTAAVEPEPQAQAAPSQGQPSQPAQGAGWRSRMDAARAAFRAASADVKRLAAEDMTLVAQHAEAGLAERRVIEAKVAQVEREMQAGVRAAQAARAEFAAAKEEARRSGADAGEYRGEIEQ